MEPETVVQEETIKDPVIAQVKEVVPAEENGQNEVVKSPVKVPRPSKFNTKMTALSKNFNENDPDPRESKKMTKRTKTIKEDKMEAEAVKRKLDVQDQRLRFIDDK